MTTANDAILATRPLSDHIGAEVVDVDRERLSQDPGYPAAVLRALEEHSVLVFREVAVEDTELKAFADGIATALSTAGGRGAWIMPITQSPDDGMANYLRGNLLWHMDGATGDVPDKANLLSAQTIQPGDAGTEFASTYAAYADLTAEEQERFAGLRVVHTIEATLRPVVPDPTPEEVAGWRARPAKEHPLVWHRRSGRRSLVLSSTADHVVGMDLDEGRALLSELLRRATRPERVLRHDWTVGDLVIWDNTGLVHRVTHHDPTSKRKLHRATIPGDEAIR